MGSSSSRRKLSGRSGSESSYDSVYTMPSPRRGRKNYDVGQEAVAIIPKKLYVGSRLDGMIAKMSNPRKFTHILCLEQSGKYPDNDKIKYLQEPLDDDGGDDLLEFAPQVKAFIDDAMNNGGKILIHCTSGVNRGPAVTVWYLMAGKDMSFQQAMNLVGSKRQGMHIHPNYMEQLESMSKISKKHSSAHESAMEDEDIEEKENAGPVDYNRR